MFMNIPLKLIKSEAKRELDRLPDPISAGTGPAVGRDLKSEPSGLGGTTQRARHRRRFRRPRGRLYWRSGHLI